MSIKKIIYILLNLLFVLILFSIFTLSKTYLYNNKLKFIVLLISITSSIISITSLYLKNIKLSKISFLISFLTMLIFVIYHILNVNKLLFIFRSVDSFKSYILSTGNRGVFIYIFIQMVQVIFLPIPASIIAIAGAIIYGPLLGAIYCIIGVLLGSYISFFLGRYIGFRLVVWIAGIDNAKKYASILNNSGRIFLGIAFLLPMFPDDILCLIAGLTTMSFKEFFIITSLFRPIGAICMCYFGGGYIIPFSGWGIPVWVVIGILMTTLVAAIYKNQTKIENWIINKFKKKTREKTN